MKSRKLKTRYKITVLQGRITHITGWVQKEAQYMGNTMQKSASCAENCYPVVTAVWNDAICLLLSAIRIDQKKRASWLIMPSALTAASRTSATSQRSNGTTSLYKACGEAEPKADLSLRSAFKLSGEEL
ncbi:hypothetical protein GQX74_004172 [Glossina fuscipes]|nr:hypothetical protein GQX74_004172 [Glossina fuscipes]